LVKHIIAKFFLLLDVAFSSLDALDRVKRLKQQDAFVSNRGINIAPA